MNYVLIFDECDCSSQGTIYGGYTDERHLHYSRTMHRLPILRNGLQPLPRGLLQLFPFADTDEEVGGDLGLYAHHLPALRKASLYGYLSDRRPKARARDRCNGDG